MIQNSPSQIYHYALPLSPPLSWLQKSYIAELSREVKVVKGLSDGWGSCSRTVAVDGCPWAIACWKDTLAVGLQSPDIITFDVITGSEAALLLGHDDWVTSLTFSLDGRSLVSGSQDTTLKLWDVQTGGVIKTFHGHTDYVFSISLSLDQTIVASGSGDETIRLWNIQTGECHHIIDQLGEVDWVSFSPTNPQHLLSISGGDVQQWDIDGCQIKPTCEGSHAAFSLDGTHFALCGEKGTTVQNSDSGVIVAEYPIYDYYPRFCCFSPDSRLIAVAAGTTAYIWDITGSDLHPIETFIGHTEKITFLAFSSSSSLISAARDNSVKFWQIGAPFTSQAATGPNSTSPIPTPIQSVSLQAEEGIAISSDYDGIVKTWDISTGICKASFQIPADGAPWRDAQMIDGRLVVVWHMEWRIYIWDTKKGELLHELTAGWDGDKDIKISGDGSKVFLLVGNFI
jgi:WD40 repeat protein